MKDILVVDESEVIFNYEKMKDVSEVVERLNIIKKHMTLYFSTRAVPLGIFGIFKKKLTWKEKVLVRKNK